MSEKEWEKVHPYTIPPLFQLVIVNKLTGYLSHIELLRNWKNLKLKKIKLNQIKLRI